MIIKAVHMRCDHDGCTAEVREVGEYATKRGVKITGLHRGWLITRYAHLCPDHQEDR